MLKGKLLAIALLIALSSGVVFLARFSSGSSYPEGSSLNTGPRGAALLFTALERSGRVSATRNYLPLDGFEVKNSALLLLGNRTYALQLAGKSWIENIERLARNSNRVVLGIEDESRPFFFGKDEKSDLQKRWNVLLRRDGDRLIAEPGGEWQKVAERAWRRRFGAGELLLIAGADRLNNRSLASNAAAHRLAAVAVGSAPTVIFDESHLGIAETGSIAALARRYRLSGLVVGLLAFVSLWMWRNAVQFPPAEDAGSTNALPAQDGRQMMASLLEQHIAPDALLPICIEEWNRVRPKQKLDAAEWRGREPSEAFAAIRTRLGQRRLVRRRK